MKKTSLLVSAALCLGLVLNVLLWPAPAKAHRLHVSYDMKQIDLRVYFGGGGAAEEADVTVYDPEGNVYLTGKTDDEGKFSFEPSGKEGEWKVSAEHAGHRVEETILAGSGGSGEGEMPLYARVIAGFGYLAGIAGVALGIMWWRDRRRRGSNAVSSN